MHKVMSFKGLNTFSPQQRGYTILGETAEAKIQNRRHPDSNWGIKVLQTSALPLSYIKRPNRGIEHFPAACYANIFSIILDLERLQFARELFF